MVVVRARDDPIIITPVMEPERVAEMRWIKDVRVREDGRAATAAVVNRRNDCMHSVRILYAFRTYSAAGPAEG